MIRTRNAPTSGAKRRRTGPKSSKPKKNGIFRPMTLQKGFPKMMNFKHSYSETLLIQAPSDGFFNQQFSVNGMFDPNTTGIGHQPYYFDTLATLYDQYSVLSSTCKFTFLADSLSTPAPFTATTWLNDDTVALGSFAIKENPTAKNLMSGGSNPMVTFSSQKWNAYDNFGPSPLANSRLIGTATANPTEQQFYSLQLRANDNVTSVGVYVLFEIEYIAVWTELKEQAIS